MGELFKIPKKLTPDEMRAKREKELLRQRKIEEAKERDIRENGLFRLPKKLTPEERKAKVEKELAIQRAIKEAIYKEIKENGLFKIPKKYNRKFK